VPFNYEAEKNYKRNGRENKGRNLIKLILFLSGVSVHLQ
jgi:hypothetical protein